MHSSKLSAEDFKCLLDHLAKEASLLLKKIDRCKMLLQIVRGNGFNGDLKYIDQMISVINQLPEDTVEKFPLSCELLGHLLVNPQKLRDNEEAIYEWALKESKRESGKEIEFYSIKLKHDVAACVENELTDEVEIESRAVDDLRETIRTGHPFTEDTLVTLTELTSDDLQKLKIFQSFDLE